MKQERESRGRASEAMGASQRSQKRKKSWRVALAGEDGEKRKNTLGQSLCHGSIGQRSAAARGARLHSSRERAGRLHPRTMQRRNRMGLTGTISRSARSVVTRLGGTAGEGTFRRGRVGRASGVGRVGRWRGKDFAISRGPLQARQNRSFRQQLTTTAKVLLSRADRGCNVQGRSSKRSRASSGKDQHSGLGIFLSRSPISQRVQRQKSP